MNESQTLPITVALIQHQRILLAAKEGWMCQREVLEISKSPHRRRVDITDGNDTDVYGQLGVKGC